MTESELTDIRARLAAVPAGPWWVDAGGPDETCDLVTADNREIASFPFYAPFRNRGVEEFVAHAPTDIALLLSEVDRLRAELAEALATLANERGEGEPPVEGWKASLRGESVRWADKGSTRPGRVCDAVRGHYERTPGAVPTLCWHWWDRDVDLDGDVGDTHAEGTADTARAAIRDASAAKGGAR